MKQKMVAQQTDIQKLIDERDLLMDVINNHRHVCSDFRGISLPL